MASTRHRVCPWWIGYLLLVPLRRLRQSPMPLLGPLVGPGMMVLEPGPGMGYFTLDIARMVGPSGRVVAVDVQERMLRTLRRRAERAGLAARIDLRRVEAGSLGVDDLAGRIDRVLAIYVVHEMPDAARFFAAAHRALKGGGQLLLAEPWRHVTGVEFERSLEAARRAGFSEPAHFRFPGARAVLLSKV